MIDRPATRIKWEVVGCYPGGVFTIYAELDDCYRRTEKIPAAHTLSAVSPMYCFQRALAMQNELVDLYMEDNF